MRKVRRQAARPEPWTPASHRQELERTIARASSGNRAALSAFASWLEHERGFASGSMCLAVRSVRPFVEAVTRDGRLGFSAAFRKLGSDAVEDFFVRYGRSAGPGSRREVCWAMWLFLTFASQRSWVSPELAGAVPRFRRYKLSHLPRGLREDQLARLIRSVSTATPTARDRAIVYLLATYGVRAGHVASLRLDDIVWEEHMITFAGHKGGKAIRHTLTDAIAESLARYLRHERPDSDCPYVFLRSVRPHLRLAPHSVTDIVRAEMLRSGLDRRGPHTLRHTFATRVLGAGKSLKDVADLLGHRSLRAVEIYAKVDQPRLLMAAAEWPEVVS
jgi:integrase/recombinase XerD